MKKCFLCCVYDSVTMQVIQWYDYVFAESFHQARFAVCDQFEAFLPKLAQQYHAS